MRFASCFRSVEQRLRGTGRPVQSSRKMKLIGSIVAISAISLLRAS
jgi:uncharacterized membrane protein YqhA